MPAKLTARQARSYGIKSKGGNKFNARKTTLRIDGEDVVFDSKKEAERYLVLLAMQERGEICGLRRQDDWILEVNGIVIGIYRADAVYEVPYAGEFGNGLRMVVEDTKSIATRKLAAYRIKKKLMRAIHGIDIHEV
jgi:hypothetical protein